MIQLYHNTNTNFDKNGDIILLPDLCEVTAGINRTWQLDIHHPIDEDGRWKGIVNNAVIKAPSFKPYGTQLWRIVQTEKSDSGITATCDPICYDAAQEVFFIQKSLNNLTAQRALDSICQDTKYRGYSNITGRHTTNYLMANLIEIVQSHENGIQKTWGGEVGFNNYEIQLFEHIGGEPGTVISYGKNIAVDGFTESVNIDGVITRLIPEGYAGRLMDGTPWVDSPNINKYATVRIGTKNYDHLRLKGDPEGDETKDGIYFDTKAELDAALREAALQEFADGLDRPKVNLEINVVLLENSREYAEYKNVDDLTLGDEVICRHQRLDVDTQSRVIQVRFDCIKEKIVYVEIGDRKRNYFDNVSSTIEAAQKAITPDGDIIASQIDGFINGAKAQLRLQNTVTQKQEAIAILFEDTDPNSATFGALALGTQGLQISKTRSGDEWVWGTAITSEGIIADYVVAGILSDKNTINYWNLDTGEFSLSSAAKVGGKTVDQIATTAANAAVSAQTQQDVFNKLTNNGASQGIYLSNGQLYINGTYIQAGQINANLITAGTIKDAANKNSWNLATGALSTSGAVVSGGSITGASINNGSGTFQVDTNGNLKATSAEITGDIKSGSTITGSAISGGTITGAQISSQATIGQVVKNASLNQGKIEFSQTNSSAPANNSTTTIDGYGVTYKRPNGAVPTTTNLSLGLTVSADNTNQSTSVVATGVTVDNTAQGGNLNRVSITSDNIRIYVNGQVVWSAR